MFCSCSRVVEALLWLRTKLFQLMPNTIGGLGTSNAEFLILQYPKDTQESECLWLIGNYVDVVDSFVARKNKKLGVDQLRGILRARLQGMSTRAVVRPEIFNI